MSAEHNQIVENRFDMWWKMIGSRYCCSLLATDYPKMLKNTLECIWMSAHNWGEEHHYNTMRKPVVYDLIYDTWWATIGADWCKSMLVTTENVSVKSKIKGMWIEAHKWGEEFSRGIKTIRIAA